MPKSFNVMLNSVNKISGGTNTNASYNINMNSLIPQMELNKKYKVTFSFMSCRNTVNTLSKFPIIEIILGQSSVFSSSNVSFLPSNYIGFLEPQLFYATSNYCYFKASNTTNNSFYINSIPIDYKIDVKIYDNNGTNTFYTDDASATIGNYILNLNFEQIEE